MRNAKLLVLNIVLLFGVVKGYGTPTASFTADQTSGCAPFAVTFTSTSTGATTYYWTFGNGNSSTLPNPSNTYTSPGQYTVTLAVSDATGNTNTTTYTNYINVVDYPNAGFYSSSTAACPDVNSFQFYNTSTGATSYTWDFGDGSVSTDPQPTHTYVQSGTFTVTLIATNQYGCEDVANRSQYITIYPKPDASVIANTAFGCDTSTVFTFSNNSSSITSYLWNFGDGTTSTQANPTHRYRNNGTFPVSLYLQNSFGCTDTSDFPFQIRVGPGYWPGLTMDKDTGCAPLTVHFNNPNQNIASCQWNFGDGTSSTQLTPDHTYNTPGYFTVTLNITSSSGCTVNASSHVFVLDKPTVSFTYTNTTGCAPLAVSFTNTSQNYDSCRWLFGDGTTSYLTNPTHSYTNSGIFNVTLQCWNAAGCSKSTTISNLVTVTNTQAAFTASQRMGCPPLPVDFTALTSNTNVTYLWDFGDGSTSNTQNPSHTYSSAGAFDVRLIVSDLIGCIDTMFRGTYVQTINPTAGYTPPPTTVGCAPLTTQFTDATMGAISWQWNFGDGTTSTQQNPVHTYTLPGFYTVSLTTTSAGGGCVQTITNFSTFDVRGGYAGFSSTASPCPPYVAQLNDTSLNAVSWLWSFGDGSTSTDRNPSHTFSVGGYHSVSLSIVTADGCAYSTMQNNGLYFTPFGANFYSEPLDTALPTRVQFHANSIGATGWIWDFGDGGTSNLQDPLHTYTANATNPVTLTIYNELCTLSYSSTLINFGLPVTSPVDAGNPGIPQVQMGCAPLYVSFTQDYHVDAAMSYLWDFGDGTSSTLEFPSHTYFESGVYSVHLQITDSSNQITQLFLDSIVRVTGPVAGFQVIQSTNCQQAIVTFIDTSINATSWNWNFGDSTTSSLQSPTHTYNSPQSNYIITLTVSDSLGCSNTISTSIYSNSQSPILVTETDVCGLDTLSFFTSLRNYSSYIWDFGDGDTSTLANPTHVYSQEGTFQPTLTTFDATGCSETYYAPPINVSLPIANFTTLNPRQGCNRVGINLNNLSQNADLYLWEFSDGGVSTARNPSHNFIGAGNYDVTLNVYRGNCISTKTEHQYVRVDTAYAEFSTTPNVLCYPIEVQYNDLSTNAVSWNWVFSDLSTSTLQNPLHIDTAYQYVQVMLAIVDANGCRDTARHYPVSGIVADIKADSLRGCVPHTVNFEGRLDMGDHYYWDFGDGTTSTDANPQHTYTTAGDFDVTLIIYAAPMYGGCSDTMHIPGLIHAIQPLADFSTTDLYGCAPSLVHFENLSQYSDRYLWDFGDNTSSTNDTTSHIYERPGTYTVTLVATSNAGCHDSLVKNQYIHVLGPETNFSASAYDGCKPFKVDFLDHSINATGWFWNFGDGYTENSQNPSHTFQDTGSFSVSLITTDTSGCTSFYELPQKINVHPVPVANFTTPSVSGCQPFITQLVNNSQYYDSLSWNFGDGNFSHEFQPEHSYTYPGLYQLSLITYTDFGCTDTLFAPSRIEVLPAPVAEFNVSIYAGCTPMNTQFYDHSYNLQNASYLWDLGDGTTSTLPNPFATYITPGFYSIQLQVTNANGCVSNSLCQNCIQVYDTLPPNETKIYSVSVKTNTSVEIIWENNPARDLSAYILYRLNRNTNFYDVIYTKNNIQNTSFDLTTTYVDSGLNTLANTYTYKVQAIDRCGYTIPLEQLTAHTTVNISSYAINDDIQVNWTPYQGCPVATYQLFRCVEGQPMEYVTTLTGTTYSYLDSTFGCPFTYSYRVMATDLCGTTYTSYSDTSVTKPLDSFSAQIVDVVRSTVVDNDYVLTEWKQPTVLPEKVLQFDIFRSNDNVNFSYLASVPAQQTDYLDYSVDVQEKNYYYKVQVINSCNIDESLSSNTSTIVLRGEMDEGRRVFLYWTAYEGWESGVDYYVLEKQDDYGHWVRLKQLTGDKTNYDYQE